MDFEWDRLKDRANQRKHGISFNEALTVFADPLARVFDDPEHSAEEDREIIIGHSEERRLILVAFTERDDRVRIVSAREATKGERMSYEESESQE
jgi:uncharacterized protein